MVVGDFPNFIARAAQMTQAKHGKMDREELVGLICADCDFYDPDEEEELECSAFKLASYMFEEGMVRPQDVADRLSR